MKIRAFVCAAALALAASASGAKTHPFGVDDLLAARRISAWAPSADGKLVVYALTTPLPDENRSTSAIWLQPLDGTARQLTIGKKHDTAPQVIGDSVAFLSDRDGEPQLYVLDLHGGEPRRVTQLPGGIDDFLPARDGAFFIVAARVFPDCSDEACNRTRLEKQGKRSSGRVIERLLFRHWDTWADGLRSHLFLVDAKTGHARDLTPGNFDAPPFSLGDGRGFDLSPDGKFLAFASNHDADGSASTNGDIWEVALDGKSHPRLLTADNKAYDGTPRYSPDGKSLAWRSQRIPAYESDRVELRVLDRAAAKVRNVTETYDGNVGDFAWAPDGASLYFASETAAYIPLYRVAAAGGAPRVVVGKIAVGDLRVLADGTVLYSRTSLARPTELWRLPAGAATPTVVTHVNDALFATIKMGALQERWVAAADGKKLHGLVVTPPDFDAHKKYPALFVVHGGPEGAWGDDWSYRWNPQAFAAAGYVVYLPNPRGSTGYGQEFVRGILSDWGGKVFDDLMRQADDLESLPYVDKTKIGAAGASFGGFMMNWLQGHTKRFKAILCHDGIADQQTMFATEELWFPETEFAGFPWTSEQYRKWSPIESAAQFATPELIVHGEKDYRIPVEQAYLMFTALKRRNVPARLLVFPDENHWVLKPGNARLWYAEFFDWFHHYLGGAAADPKALETSYSVTN